MNPSILSYHFLTLSLLFCIPGLVVYLLRSDLRQVIHILAIVSIPFGFTEFLFYPSYWEPKFLFDLVHVLGFGIEDLLFVIGLSAFTSTSYPFFFRKQFAKWEGTGFSPKYRILLLVLLFVTLVPTVHAMGIHLIYGAPLIMLSFSSILLFLRRDLLIPAVLGGVSSTIVYSILCFLLLWIYPSIFDLTWHTQKFLNIRWFGIPLEELIYAFSSGLSATLFYPFVFSFRFVSF